jgi:hypothetical protein
MELRNMDEYTIERMPLPVEELRVIADLTVELVRLRQNECKNLAVENIGPEIWRNLLMATYPLPKILMTDTPLGPKPFEWGNPDSASGET